MVVYIEKWSLYATKKMLGRSKRWLGLRTRKIKANNDDLIIINDEEVYVIFSVPHSMLLAL